MKLRNILKCAALASIALCAAGLYGGHRAVESYELQQYADFNDGMLMYSYKNQGCNQGQAMDPLKYHCFDAAATVKRLQESVLAYEQESKATQADWWQRALIARGWLPKPSLPLVALAHFQESNIFFHAKNAEEAITHLKACINLDPGLNDNTALSEEENSELRLTVLDCRHNYELFMAKNPQRAQQEGKGSGQGKRKPQPGELKTNGQTPADADPAGKQDRHKL